MAGWGRRCRAGRSGDQFHEPACVLSVSGLEREGKRDCRAWLCKWQTASTSCPKRRFVLTVTTCGKVT